VLAQYEGVVMSKRLGGRVAKYSDDFKRKLVRQSRVAGVSVPMVAKKHGVDPNRIYAWRSDARFQPDGPEDAAFIPVEVAQGESDAAPVVRDARPTRGPTTPSQIEITLENGRKLRVSDGVDAGFVLELARGLAA
jgi:transposase